MPAVTPPVKVLPSTTTRSATGSAPKACNRSRTIQWVAARRPRNSPAAPSNRCAGAHADDTARRACRPARIQDRELDRSTMGPSAGSSARVPTAPGRGSSTTSTSRPPAAGRGPHRGLSGSSWVRLGKSSNPLLKRVSLIACLPRGRHSCLAVEWRTGKLEETTVPLLLASPAIPPGGDIQSQYTCDGAGISPPLTWSGLQDEIKSLVLVGEDWGAFDIPAGSRGLDAGY